MTHWSKSIFAGGVLALNMLGSAAAGPLQDGAAAYQRGDYAMAMRLLRPFADQGNALAEVSLGLMYQKGQGVPQDYAQAVLWHRKAADQGIALAQLSLCEFRGNPAGDSDLMSATVPI